MVIEHVVEKAKARAELMNRLVDQINAVPSVVADAQEAAQAFAIQRGNHTGEQPASSISDFSTAVDARITAADLQPLSSDLMAIAALTTTPFGRALLELIDAPTLTAALNAATTSLPGIVELATSPETLTGTDPFRAVTPAGLQAKIDALVNAAPGIMDTLGEIAALIASDETAAGALATAVAGKQPLATTLTALAALTTTPYGRALLALVDGSVLADDPAFTSRYATGTDAFALARLTDAVAADRNLSVQKLRTARDDSAKIIESWANLTAWLPAANAQVSVGKCYALAANNPAGGTQPLAIPKFTPFRITTTINLIAGGTGIVGVGLNTLAGPLGSGAGASVMWGFNGTIPYKLSDASRFGVAARNLVDVTGTQVGIAQAADTWILTITADNTNIFMSLVNKTDRNREFIDTILWSAMPLGIANIAFWNSDNRALGGSSIGPIGAIVSNNTTAPRTGVEGVGYGIFEGTSAAGDLFRIYTPASYDSRISTPVVIYHHGVGGTAQSTWLDNSMPPVTKAQLDAGYIVASTSSAGNNWGNQASIDANYALYLYLRDHYAIGPIMHIGQSMGGLSSLLTIAARRVPAAAWLGIYPATNLASLHAAGWTAAIDTAYGIPGTGSYAVQTGGHDPQLMPATAFRGLPMRFYASAGDTSVPKVSNTDLMAAKCAAYAPECVVVATAGDHGDPSNFVPAEVVAFFNRYRTL